MNRQILKLAVPFIISNITVPLVSSVDTALMGNFGTTAHLGAIGLGGAIFNFLYWNFAFIRMSTVGMTAQSFGKKNKEEIAVLLGRAMFISLLGAALLIFLRQPIEKLTFTITKAEAIVEEYTSDYFSIRIWAAPATIGLSTLTGWLIGLQNAKAPMIIAIVVNLINICLSYILVAFTGLKSEGVAIGTVAGQYTGLLIAIVILYSKYRDYLKLLSYKLIINLKGIKRFFLVNIDVFIRTLAVIIVLTWFNIVSAEKGKLILGINVIFLQLVYAFSFFIDGFANAAEALVGKYYGAGNTTNLKLVIRYLFVWGFCLALIFTTTYAIAWRQIISIYTNDQAIIDLARNYAGWIIAIPMVSITTFIWDGIFLGATATKEQRNATIVSAILFFTIYKLLEPAHGNHALLFAQLVFFGMRGILQTFYYKPAILKKF